MSGHLICKDETGSTDDQGGHQRMGSTVSGISPASRSLDGVRICLLRDKDYSADGRALKQAAALRQAGAVVTMVGVGEVVQSVDSSNGVHLVPAYSRRAQYRSPRLGREEVWWPLRVMVNLTYTRLKQWWYIDRPLPPFPNEAALFAAAMEHNPDVVHAFNIQTLSAAVRLKRAIGARVVYDCRDLYTDVDYKDAHTKGRWRTRESKLIRQVDAVITVSDALADALQAKYPITRPVPIYNGPVEVMPSTEPVSQPVRLFFQGYFARHRNLAALIEAMLTLRDCATLTLQGFGGIEEALKQQVRDLGLEGTVFFIPRVQPLEVVRSASGFDVGVVCHLGTNINMQSAVPNKLMDYLGAGLAVAVSDLPGHRSVLDGTDAGMFIDPSTPETIAKGLSQILDDPARITEMKQAALELAMRYQWPLQAEKMIRVYDSVLDGAPARTR